jgi:hypothetical protein
VSEDPSRAVWLSQARAYLRHADPVLARLIDGRPGFDPRAWLAQLPPMDLYGALLFQVTGQQLSVAATRRTLARIRAVFGGHLPAPAELLAVDPGQLRQAGLSWRKVGTLRDLAERMTDGRLNQELLCTGRGLVLVFPRPVRVRTRGCPAGAVAPVTGRAAQMSMFDYDARPVTPLLVPDR